MKRKIFMIVCLLLAGAITCLQAQDTKQDKKQSKAQQQAEDKAIVAQAVAECLAQKNYVIAINNVEPTGRRAFIPDPGYFFKVQDGQVSLQLPYVGTGYNVPYGGGEGLRFTSPIEQYTEQAGKKGTTLITVLTKNAEGQNATFNLTIHPVGTTSLKANVEGLQAISYSGYMDLKAQPPAEK